MIPNQRSTWLSQEAVSGRVVDVVSGSLCQPGFHFGMFVCGVIIDDEMHIEILGHAGIDVSQEGEELLMSVASLALGDHFTVGDIERGKQRGWCRDGRSRG